MGSSSYCVTIKINTNNGQYYNLRIDPHNMEKTGSDSSIFLKKDILMLKTVTNINDLSKALIDLVDFEAEFQDIEELVYNICVDYDAEENVASYSDEINKAETVLEKLKIFKHIRDNYYNSQFDSIEKSDNTKRKITSMKKKMQAQKDDLINAGYGGLYESIENYTNQLQNEINIFCEISEIVLSQVHYTWGTFAAEYFYEDLLKEISLSDEDNDDIILQKLKAIFSEDSDFDGMISAYKNNGPNVCLDTVVTAINMQSWDICITHIVNMCS